MEGALSCAMSDGPFKGLEAKVRQEGGQPRLLEEAPVKTLWTPQLGRASLVGSPLVLLSHVAAERS